MVRIDASSATAAMLRSMGLFGKDGVKQTSYCQPLISNLQQSRCASITRRSHMEESVLNKDPKISKVMEKLYGPAGADKVFKRLQFLDPALNRLIQDFAYEQVWGKIGGDNPAALKVKSIATISALIALGREEQIRIHLTGFFNLQGSITEIRMLIKEMQAICGEASASKAKLALDDTVRELEREGQEVRKGVSDTALPRSLQHVILLSARIAMADKEKMEQAIHEIAVERTLNIEEVGNIINHMAVYCGFPSAMDGFAALRKCEMEFRPTITCRL